MGFSEHCTKPLLFRRKMAVHLWPLLDMAILHHASVGAFTLQEPQLSSLSACIILLLALRTNIWLKKPLAGCYNLIDLVAISPRLKWLRNWWCLMA
jgi:hypothetical protein